VFLDPCTFDRQQLTHQTLPGRGKCEEGQYYVRGRVDGVVPLFISATRGVRAAGRQATGPERQKVRVRERAPKKYLIVVITCTYTVLIVTLNRPIDL
jgi:hypothetical protein